MEHPLVYVKKSSIHGKGLFAKTKIKRGAIIGTVKGKRTKRDGPHVLWFDGDPNAFRVECILKYINHAPTPNAVYYDDLTVVALRNIKPDEEITHDYGEEWI